MVKTIFLIFLLFFGLPSPVIKQPPTPPKKIMPPLIKKIEKKSNPCDTLPSLKYYPNGAPGVCGYLKA